MKFSTAIDSLTKENGFLRNTVKGMSLVILLLSLAVLFLHDKNPVLVERTSRGMEIVHLTPLLRSDADMEQALKIMLHARFDTNAINPGLFLTKRQTELRETEQKEMAARGITQSTVFRKSSASKTEATIEFDRVLAVGEIRSALKTTVRVAFEEADPSELNPYGLVLALASPQEKKEDK
jgi:hypothetical protein